MEDFFFCSLLLNLLKEGLAGPFGSDWNSEAFVCEAGGVVVVAYPGPYWKKTKDKIFVDKNS